jgi:META domain
MSSLRDPDRPRFIMCLALPARVEAGARVEASGHSPGARLPIPELRSLPGLQLNLEEASRRGLVFGALATTRRAGPPPAMRLESPMLKALEATLAYQLSADDLDLLDAAGDRVARFSAKPAP